jgi:UDP-N-acetylglucosamine--N-acetylmuramyl-(pentapeptide) pyrophosphoryl-undecaprenol N-acetylglucosamine transferase
MRALIASGGSGGHIFPALSVAEEIKSRRPEAQLLFMGARSKGVKELLLPQGGCAVDLPAVGFPRRVSVDLAAFVFRLAVSFGRCVRRIARFRPHVAVGFGNFGSFAPLVAARSLGVPIAIHEANAVPGKANVVLSRLSDKVLVNFPGTARYFPNRNVEAVGMPVRKEFIEARDRPGALAKLKLSSTKFTLLVIGGSQGARALNLEMCNLLRILERTGGEVQVIHLSGETDYPWVSRRYGRSSLAAYVSPFESNVKALYDAADLVVARAGASTIAEIVRTGKPAVLVPFPYATAHHQEGNARYLEERGGAVVLRQQCPSAGAGLIPGFVGELTGLMADRRRLQEMGEASRSLGNGCAARKIADVLFRIARSEEAAVSRMKRSVAVRV